MALGLCECDWFEVDVPGLGGAQYKLGCPSSDPMEATEIRLARTVLS